MGTYFPEKVEGNNNLLRGVEENISSIFELIFVLMVAKPLEIETEKTHRQNIKDQAE
jgi:hypothetical protein